MREKQKVQVGLERLLTSELNRLRGARIGLLCNQASVDHQFNHAADLFAEHPEIRLTTLFGPQHGIRGDVQDNMIETGHAADAATGLPIYSLYSETREPTAEMLREVDVLVCDLPDIGGRVYTFVYTIANCMRIAGKLGKKVVVCDRPNPINGARVAGNVLKDEWKSFVGAFPIAMRHGMTVGELATMFRRIFGVECDLTVVKMEGWRRELWYDETDAPWVMPSPNMPTLDAATVFPGTVLLEGTQVSEGRGTTRPFEIVGAPYIVAADFARALQREELPGVHFRPVNFLPTFQKHAGVGCGGVQLHVLNRDEFEPVLTGIAIVKAASQMYPEKFAWKVPPYEYVYDRNPFDVIAGTDALRVMIEQNQTLNQIEAGWQDDLAAFKGLREQCLLY